MGNFGSLLMCYPDSLTSDQPLVQAFRKPASPVGGPPDDPTLKAYYDDKLLRPPAGTWRIYVYSRFTPQTCYGGTHESIHLEASVVVHVE
jgi:hypothetical protein